MNTSIISSALAQHREAVERRITDAYIDAGYAVEHADGTDVADEDAMKSAVLATVSAAYAANRDSKSKVGLTKGELYAVTFPDGPGAASGTADGLDEIESEAREVLMRRVWNLAKDTPDGYVQKRLDGNVLIRSQVVRDRDLVMGVYVTDDPQLILEESLMPGVEALVRRADRLREHALMLVSRQPQLEQKVGAALNTGAKRANTVVRGAIGTGGDS
jgi:hypothetical protein